VRIGVVKTSAFVLVAVLVNIPGDVFPHAATSNTVLFDREIVRVLNEHCVMCHVDGGASFPLETYEQAWLARREIHDAILARTMPPWGAVPGYGDFVNDNGLTLREKRFIVSWVEGLGPRNDGEVFLNVQGAEARTEIRAGIDWSVWQIGEPDVVFAVPQPDGFADGDDSFDADEGGNATDVGLRVGRSVIDTGLDAAAWLRALEYHPVGLENTRAIVFSLEENGQWLATWTPWHGIREFSDDAAIRLPASARIVAEFHVVDDPPAFEAGELALSFVSTRPSADVTDIVVEATSTTTDTDGRQRVEARHTVDGNTTVLELWPVLPAGTESVEVRVREPGGRIRILLSVLDPVADWPTSYLLDEPSHLPSGSELRFIVYRTTTDSNAAASSARLVLSAYEE